MCEGVGREAVDETDCQTGYAFAFGLTDEDSFALQHPLVVSTSSIRGRDEASRKERNEYILMSVPDKMKHSERRQEVLHWIITRRTSLCFYITTTNRTALFFSHCQSRSITMPY